MIPKFIKSTFFDSENEVAIILPKAKAKFLFGADTEDGILANISEMLEPDAVAYGRFKAEYEAEQDDLKAKEQ